MPALPENVVQVDNGQTFHHRKPMQSKAKNKSWPFSEPTLTIVSLNIKGITKNKEDIISQLCQSEKWDVLCLQETHRDETANRPNIKGMRLAIEAPHRRYGSAIFTRPDMLLSSTSKKITHDIEVLTIESGSFTISSVYKPPGQNLDLSMPGNFNNQKTQFVVGDFNCYSTTWGYGETDSNGQLLEQWAEATSLSLLHDPKLPCSFNSKI